MINKLQYLGEIKHDNMYVKDSPFITDETLPFNQVYYRMIRSGNEINHCYYCSQNEEYLEEGYVYTSKNYISIVEFLDIVCENMYELRDR
jgi:hypothetical protein